MDTDEKKEQPLVDMKDHEMYIVGCQKNKEAMQMLRQLSDSLGIAECYICRTKEEAMDELVKQSQELGLYDMPVEGNEKDA